MSEFETVQPTDVPAGAQLIDIREVDEYNQWHAEGATNLPLSELQARYGELDLNEDIYLICLSGGRSARACQWLEQNGIDAINVANGTAGWRDAGLPIVGQPHN
ncbi:rhodanese-like domain-containing protein [Corynebacterium jeikeium]|jgi:rhodanese-related sulfurtransferase|uniref:Rhodanese domain-containing protein n=3 Tax=Actinomycetes TaxID=1760 RepID=Q4JXN3_CORJK|nr:MULTISPECIES: rhodanese-like domain-containing protein [Corynebacterium]EEW16725.1 rhodanese-like protein [Corynebacterium jeikeium ATCC 43734]MCG7259479.1 rhodanese-like domain-containing protein [Corynebacterium sp. ACRQK]MCG7264003.1 rhodanese-like domain-containing protein [Corynebacterium sp. ACRQL]MCZ9289899.1 rhodanese-like domain-containing protein [Corynebacterium evansiae]OFT36585.1 sulfurtransferase [Corynebacterium sp. HMSC08A12]